MKQNVSDYNIPGCIYSGQLNLSKTSVLVVGCGGLGCPLAQYLAAAGIGKLFIMCNNVQGVSSQLTSISTGRLGLLDYDEVELSNLHRQVLHWEENRGEAKALSAANAVRRYLSETGTLQLIKCVNKHVKMFSKQGICLFAFFWEPFGVV